MARARGKIILAGEHSVVYGYPAIASTIPRFVSVEAFESNIPGFQFPPLWQRGVGGILIERLTQMLGSRVSRLQFNVKSEIPGGCGLGSSAALSVGLIRAILEYFGETRMPSEIANMALELEKIFHGNPSGVDHTVIAKEGMIWFQQARAERINCPVRIPIVVAVTSPHAGTLKAVQAVRERYEAERQLVVSIFDSIGGVTRNMKNAIEAGNLAVVGELMNQNHALLAELGVSTPELNAVCHMAMKHGALGAKLTGAGGGGCVIALSLNADMLVQVFKDSGYDAFAVQI